MHKKQVHKKPAQDPEENSSGKQKPDYFESRLSKKPTGNTIRNSAGFMVMENGENGENEEATPDVSENRTKPKKRKLSERLQDPIIVKERSKQVKVNSFRTQILTLKKKLSRMQREVGTEPDYVILIKNNLQDPTTSNPSASAGKYFVFGEGPIKEKLIEQEVKFDQKQMFLMANNHNFEEEKVKKASLVEEKTKKTKPTKKTKKNDVQKRNQVARKVATPGSFVSSISDEDSSISSAGNSSSSSSSNDSSSSVDSSD